MGHLGLDASGPKVRIDIQIYDIRPMNQILDRLKSWLVPDVKMSRIMKGVTGKTKPFTSN